MARDPSRGGFRRPVQLSLWIRDHLSDGQETWAYRLYGDYSNEMRAIPLSRKRGLRKVMKYESFLHYLYILRRLGLIEYVTTAGGEIYQETAEDKGGTERDYLAPRNYFRAVLSRIGDSAWNQIWDAYRGIR